MTPTVPRDNPAGRLYWILKRMQGTAHNQPLSKSLSETLTPERNDVGVLLERVVKMMSLPRQVCRAVDALPEGSIDKDLLLDWTDPVDAAMKELISMGGPTTAFVSKYNDGHLKSLAFCGDLIRRQSREPELKDDQLSKLSDALSELRQLLVTEASFDAEFRRIMLRHIDDMGRAVDELAMWGLVPVRNAAAETVGDLLINHDAAGRASSVHPSAWNKFMTLLTTITALLSFGTAAIQAIEATSARPPVVIVNGSVVHEADTAAHALTSGKADHRDPAAR